MTEKQMISTLKGLTFGTVVGSKGVEALEMAITALSQEPCDECRYKRTSICGNCKEYDEFEEIDFVQEHKKIPVTLDLTPSDDAISRDAVINAFADYYGCKPNDLDAFKEFKFINELPSVRPQKSGKWDRLYNWLNDMRLGIAPDETVTDIDERHCRESQTDILDEIMEWMIKAEVEPQESEE